MNFLKQSTAVTPKIGPFLDSTDMLTAKTALSIGQADVLISKADGSIAQKNDTNSATHDSAGFYGVPFNVTDTGTVGRMRVSIQKTGALPVWEDYFVLPANVYDSLVGSDLLQIDLTQVIGDATSASDFKDMVDNSYDPTTNLISAKVEAAIAESIPATAFVDPVPADVQSIVNGAITANSIAAGAITAAKFASGALDAVWSTTSRTLTSFGTLIADIWASATRTLTAFGFTVATNSDTNVSAIRAKTDNLPSDPADQSLVEAAITSAVSALATATNLAAVKAILDKLDTTIVLDGAVYQFTVNALENAPSGGGTAPTAEEVAIAVVDQTLTGHTDPDTVGEALSTAGAGGIPTEIQDQITDILAGVTALQGAEVLHLSSPIGSDNAISILTAYDYKAAQGMAVTWVNSAGSWPDLTGATVKVVSYDARTDQGGTVTVVTPTGANQTVRWEVAKTTYTTSARGASKYILEATLAGGNKVPLAVGNLILR